jgi:hypothetical protein
MAFSLETGLPMDLSLRAAGDGGRDFIYRGKVYSIKSTQYWHDPHLKEYPKPKKWGDFYVLCGVDMQLSLVKVFGWATRDEVQCAPKHTYTAKAGPQHSLAYQDLHHGMPTEVPNTRKMLHIEEPQK